MSVVKIPRWLCEGGLGRGTRLAGLVVSVAMGALAGCAPSMPPLALAQKIQGSVPTCASEAECKAMWEAAQVRVANSTANPVEIVTPVLIATRKTDDEVLSIKVTKERVDSATYRIVFVGGCHEILGCLPPVGETNYKFNLYVRSKGLLSARQVDSLFLVEAKSTPWPKDTSNFTRSKNFDSWNRK